MSDFRKSVVYQCYSPSRFATATAMAWATCAGVTAKLDYLALAGGGLSLAQPVLSPRPSATTAMTCGGLPGRRPALRHDGGFRGAVPRGGQARHPPDAGHGVQPHLDRARMVPKGAGRRPGCTRTTTSGGRAARTARRPTTGRASSAAAPGQYVPEKGKWYLHLFDPHAGRPQLGEPARAPRNCATWCASGWTRAPRGSGLTWST